MLSFWTSLQFRSLVKSEHFIILLSFNSKFSPQFDRKLKFDNISNVLLLWPASKILVVPTTRICRCGSNYGTSREKVENLVEKEKKSWKLRFFGQRLNHDWKYQSLRIRKLYYNYTKDQHFGTKESAFEVCQMKVEQEQLYFDTTTAHFATRFPKPIEGSMYKWNLFVWGFTPYQHYFSYLTETFHKSMLPDFLFLTST